MEKGETCSLKSLLLQHFPGGSDCKESAFYAGDMGSIPGLGQPPEEGNQNPLQYSGLGNPMDRKEPGGLISQGGKELDMTSD